MKHTFKFIFTAITSILFVACSSDDTPYNPYDHQDKEPFYPTGIVINKENRNRRIEERWEFEYTDNRKNNISKYTHTTKTTRTTDNNTTEVTTETEKGTLSYPGENLVQNIIDYTKEVEGDNRVTTERQTITERVECSDGRASRIETIINYKNAAGNIVNSAITSRDFGYTGDHCTSSTYTDESGKPTTFYTYRWDSSHKLVSVVIDDKNEENRINRTYNYSYGPVSADHGFDINAFAYDNLPHIYAAMGMFGKSAPYTIDEEEQDFRELFNGKWEKLASSDNKVFTTTKNTNEIEIDIFSKTFNYVYNIKFIK